MLVGMLKNMDSAEDQHALNVLSYWCAIELFSPRHWDQLRPLNLRQNDGDNSHEDYQSPHEEGLPWDMMQATLTISLVQNNKSSFNQKCNEARQDHGYQIVTDMRARLLCPFSFTQATTAWINSQTGTYTDTDPSPIQEILEKKQNEWYQLTQGTETLPTGSLISDDLVTFLVNAMKDIAKTARIPGAVWALYFKTSGSNHSSKKHFEKLRFPLGSKDMDYHSTYASWLRHDFFRIRVGLSEQVIFNALLKAAGLVRRPNNAERTEQDERLQELTEKNARRPTMQRNIASLMSFTVRDDGHLGPVTSVTISQYAKAVSCLFGHKGWPSCPSGWPHIESLYDNEKNAKEAYASLTDDSKSNALSRHVDRGTLRYIIDTIAQNIGLSDDAVRRSPLYTAADGSPVIKDYVDCCSLSENDGSSGDDMIDSFYLSDLEELLALQERKIKRSDNGSDLLSIPLRQYLSRNHPYRIDVSQNLNGVNLDACTQPNRIPTGRWPSQLNQFQSVGQQLAIDQITTAVDNEGDGYLLGVNGPPGTGKTTILRDIIAQIVVARACQLVRFDEPQDIFKSSKRTNGSKSEKTLPYWTLDQRVVGYEIVVASNNNKSVENISEELPSIDAIANEWQTKIDMQFDQNGKDFAFRQSADAIARFDGSTGGNIKNGDRGCTDSARPSSQWSLLAARLGNKKNIHKFVKPFESNFIQKRLNLSHTERSTAKSKWNEARQRFQNALIHEQRIRETIEQKFMTDHYPSNLLQQEKQLRDNLKVTETQLSQARQVRNTLKRRLYTAEKEAYEAFEQAERNRRACMEAHAMYREQQHYWSYHWFAAFIHSNQQRQSEYSSAQALEHAVAAKNASRAYADQTQVTLERMKENFAAHDSKIASLKLHRQSLENSLVQCQKRIHEYNTRPKHVSTLTDDRVNWIDEEWNEARTEVFIQALALHKQLVIGSAKQFHDNLTLACRMLESNQFTTKEQLTAWQSFFLVVPVVSSSFASIHNMFSGMQKESLGWAIIDEAGQATTQSAAGLLQRARHAVAVGDPMQLKPIDTLPAQMRELLAYTHDIEIGLESGNMQEMVDYQTPYGMHAGSNAAWIGMPLVVHRRCDEPMFSITNDMAYSKRMVRVGPSHIPCRYMAGKKKDTELPRSCWYDVPGQSGESCSKQSRQKEQDELYDKLKDLIEGGISPEKILVITPFRAVANAVRTVFATVLKECGHYDTAAAEELARNHAGTVHTSQGREADVVFLVLGSQPGKEGKGSRVWVNNSPNLLNVAVSRARRRLYVIGNLSDWNRGKYSAMVADGLKPQEPPVST